MGIRYIYCANLLRFPQVKKLLFIKNHPYRSDFYINAWKSTTYPKFLICSPFNFKRCKRIKQCENMFFTLYSNK